VKARRASVLAAMLVAVSCTHQTVEEVSTTTAAPVSTVRLAPQTFESIVTATGAVSAAPGADWTITAPEPARIVELPKAEGDPVRPGELLVRFEIPSLATEVATRRAETEQAQARVDNAQASVDRLTTLVQHGVAAQKELEDARRELAEARASRAQAQAAGRNATLLESRAVVRARFPGVVVKRGHNPGDIVEASASDVVLRVVNPARLQVVAAIAIPDVTRVRVGKPARILAPGTESVETGKVLTAPAAVEAGGVAADVRVSFDAPTRLPIGTPVRLEIVAEEHPNALAVPVAAVLHEDKGAYVMLAGSDNKAHKRTVSIGLSTPKSIEVVRGVQPGDAVIVQGHQGLPDGAAITVTQ
jgi:RND family efflux transporter MFP subunit